MAAVHRLGVDGATHTLTGGQVHRLVPKPEDGCASRIGVPAVGHQQGIALPPRCEARDQGVGFGVPVHCGSCSISALLCPCTVGSRHQSSVSSAKPSCTVCGRSKISQTAASISRRVPSRWASAQGSSYSRSRRFACRIASSSFALDRRVKSGTGISFRPAICIQDRPGCWRLPCTQRTSNPNVGLARSWKAAFTPGFVPSNVVKAGSPHGRFLGAAHGDTLRGPAAAPRDEKIRLRLEHAVSFRLVLNGTLMRWGHPHRGPHVGLRSPQARIPQGANIALHESVGDLLQPQGSANAAPPSVPTSKEPKHLEQPPQGGKIDWFRPSRP